MAKKVNQSEIVVGQNYGILNWGGASSGAWTIAKIVKVGKDKCIYEVPNGLDRFEKRECKPCEVFDAQECARESILNRPEYSAAYQFYL